MVRGVGVLQGRGSCGDEVWRACGGAAVLKDGRHVVWGGAKGKNLHPGWVKDAVRNALSVVAGGIHMN